jgi:urease accessory protein
MSAAVLQSEPSHIGASRALHGIRARGGVHIEFHRSGSRTSLRDLREWGGFRAKLPRTDSLCEAVLINTGGGMLGGDNVDFRVDVAAGAAAQVCTQSAERIYRSLGPTTMVAVHLTVADQARLHWLPQETILFDRARLARTITADLAADASLVLVESVIFGRAAMNESVSSGMLRDTWRIRRDGRLVFADTIRIDEDISSQLTHPAVGNGATTMATILLVAPDAEDRRDGLRATMENPQGRFAASAWNGMLVCRLLAPAADALKADLGRALTYLSRQPLPRVWGAP